MPRSPKLVEIRTGVDSGGRWNQQQTISGEDLGMVALTVGQVIGVFLHNCSGDCLLDSGSSEGPPAVGHGQGCRHPNPNGMTHDHDHDPETEQ